MWTPGSSGWWSLICETTEAWYAARSCLPLWFLVTHGGREGGEMNPPRHLVYSAISYVMCVWEQFLPDPGEDWLLS